MLDKDKKILSQMAEDYSIQEILKELAVCFADKADVSSDMLLKEKAVEYSDISEYLLTCLYKY
jgi:hypothetical protein